MKHSRFGLPLVLAALAAVVPVHAQPLRTVAPAHHSLWRVEGKSNVVYLLGSIHLLKPENYPLAAPIEEAFTNAQIAAFETDVGQLTDTETQMKILKAGQLPEGQTLAEQLSPATYAQVTNYLQGAGVPEIMYAQFKPGMAAVTIEAMAWMKFGANVSVDLRYYERARRDGKQIVQFEDVDFEIGMITDLTKDEGEALVRSTLKEVADIGNSAQPLITAWQTGDAITLNRLLHEGMQDAPGIFKKLVTDRNRKWLPKIEEFLRGKDTAIVIVGAGHMVGADGLVELLKKKGYKITQL